MPGRYVGKDCPVGPKDVSASLSNAVCVGQELPDVDPDTLFVCRG